MRSSIERKLSLGEKSRGSGGGRRTEEIPNPFAEELPQLQVNGNRKGKKAGRQKRQNSHDGNGPAFLGRNEVHI